MRKRRKYPFLQGVRLHHRKLGAILDTVPYTYGDSDWGDLLVGYNGNTVTSDAIGNILVNGALRIGRQLLIAIALLGRSLRRQQERQQQGQHAKDRQYTDPCLSHRNYLSFPIAVSHYAVY